MFEKNESLGYLANHLARILSQGLRDRLEPTGLMPAQFTALIEISRDEGLNQKMLVERLDFDQAGIARTLRALEDGEWIERRDDAADRRVQRLFLTSKARGQIDLAAGLAVEVNDKAMKPLRPDERSELLRLLALVITGIRGKTERTETDGG